MTANPDQPETQLKSPDQQAPYSGERVPLSDAQREICIGQLLDPDSPLYNMGMLFTIEGKLDSEKFKRCWEAVVKKSDALRMCIHLDSAYTTQSVSATHVPTTEFDYSKNSHPESDALAWVQADLEKPMPLEQPLVASTLIKLSEVNWLWYCKQHHIITDATSFAVIWKEIIRLYEGTSDSSAQNIRANFLDYVSSTTAQRNNTNHSSENTSSGVADYWKNKSIPPSPTFYGRKPSFTTTYAERNTDFFGPENSAQLEALLAHPDVKALSPHLAKFQVLLTVFYSLLYRVSGQSSLAIATTVPNRSNSLYAGTPGLFVELVPLCVNVEPNDTFTTLLLKVKAEVTALFKHATPCASQHVSKRDISAVINYVPLTMEFLDNMPVKTQWLHANHIDRQHAIRLHAMDWNNAGHVSLALDTNDSCFTQEQKTDIQHHWMRLFNAFCNNRDQPIAAVDLVEESNLITASSSDDLRLEYKQPSEPQSDIVEDPIISRFSASVESFPDNTAIVSGKHQISYKQLALRVGTLTNALINEGIGVNNNVAILLPRSMAVPVALLSTLKAKATYVPIESSNPTERILQLLKSSKATAVITDKTLSVQLGDLNLSVVVLDEQGEHIQSASISANNIELATQKSSTHQSLGQCPAYILYTSGSTGLPKGVAISRTAMANYCTWATDYYTQGEQLAFPFFTPMGFDLTITSLFVPLLSGGAIHVYPSTGDFTDSSLFKVIDDNLVDIIKLTPAHLSMLQGRDLKDSHVKQLIVGGEDLKCSLAQSIYKSFHSDIKIHNEYGPTEATVGCIVHQFNPEADIAGSVPIGKPVAGMQALVLNSALRKQPKGVIGDLFICGPSLANGYWQDESQTASEFITIDQTETIYYRTGDLVRENDNGQLVYMGRLDDQVKIRGARIELAEIESYFLKMDNILNCVILPVQSGNSTPSQVEEFCNKCGLSSLYPDATLNQNGICSICTDFKKYQDKAQLYFQSKADLKLIADQLKQNSDAQYDCMMLLSGGKDSSYALAQLVDLGLRVLAYTLDNGYLSTEAKSNIKHVCKALNVDHEFAKTPSMRDIFAQSLEQFSNVCNGCFKTIYTLSMQRAKELKIPGIFTGLSRGQFFETRLTQELFSNPDINNQIIDATVMSARKAYHRSDDAVAKLLDTTHFQDESIFEEVQIYDFYRYNDVDLDEMLTYLEERLPWVRPTDTGRSTNCLINDVGIHVHKIERGFHNYSLPYSWDVRLGHKNREAALEELDDDIDLNNVNTILAEIGYQPQLAAQSEKRLALYFTAREPLDTSLLKQNLQNTLPTWMVPDWLEQLDSLPMTNNGKVDKTALPEPQGRRTITTVEFVAARTEIEKKLERIWCEQLKLSQIGIHDNFFELGGDSLSAIRIAAKINQSGIKFNSAELFDYQTIDQIARRAEQQLKETNKSEQTNETKKLNKKPAAFDSLDAGQLNTLANLLGKSNKT